MALDELIARLAEETGAEGGYPADEDGVVRLVFDDDFFVGMMEVEDRGLVLMWSPVAELSSAGGLKLAIELLKANHFGRATSGGTLSMSDEGVVFIHHQLAANGLEYDEFRRRLEDMVSAAAQWRQLIDACKDGVRDDEAIITEHVEEMRRMESGGMIWC